MPDFHLYNSLTRQTEPLVPSETDAEGTPVLRFYSCGPTVYSYAHIGNFRTFLTADLVVRVAEALGWKVRYVSNVTDVGHLTEDDVADASGEDRMAKALASKEGERFANVWDLARHYTEALTRDWQALNLREPDVRPRATEHVREQIKAVEALIENGHAYETDDGVYFHVPSFPAYGMLSGNTDADRLDVGAAGASRAVVVDEDKKDPRDFALWKKDPGHLMQWFSPFGWGFPGWHLECSVMAQQYLGETIDLHGGGEDLRFPHHECEIAQAEALSGEPFALHWMHTRFLQVEGEKMSKRLGNFLTVRDLTAPPEAGGRTDWGAPVDPLALRLVLIAGNYRQPFNFTLKALKDAQKHRLRIAEAEAAVQEAREAGREGTDELTGALNAAYDEALAAMLDDLNTPVAFAAAYRGVNRILKEATPPSKALGPKKLGPTRLSPTFGPRFSKGMSKASASSAARFLDRINALLGIVRSDYNASAPAAEADPLAAQVEALIQQRVEARKARDWARADALRAKIDALGIEVMDNPEGTTWRRKID